MEARTLFRKTMPFVWAKLLLGLATVLISVILFAILMGLSLLFQSSDVTLIMFCIWLGGVGAVRFVLMHYIGYLVKAGHIAVLTEAITTGNVPDHQVEYGKQVVKQRFATSNVYFGLDKLISGAIRQIQRFIEKAGNALDFIPGMGAVTSLAKFFVSIFLGYIDECCLGYTFLNKDQNAFKSGADGVVIYAQNWKKLLKDAAKTMALVVVLLAVIILVSFVAIGLLFRLFHWNGFIAFVVACFVAWSIKFAFIDSYIMTKMLLAYLVAVPETQITFDLYGKLCTASSSFKKLFNKGQEGTNAAGQMEHQTAASQSVVQPFSEPVSQPFAETASATIVEPSSRNAAQTSFCPNCGAPAAAGSQFCANCGTRFQ